MFSILSVKRADRIHNSIIRAKSELLMLKVTSAEKDPQRPGPKFPPNGNPTQQWGRPKKQWSDDQNSFARPQMAFRVVGKYRLD